MLDHDSTRARQDLPNLVLVVKLACISVDLVGSVSIKAVVGIFREDVERAVAGPFSIGSPSSAAEGESIGGGRGGSATAATT